jgi:hypothetical protein
VLLEEVGRLREVAAHADQTIHLFVDHVVLELLKTKPFRGVITLVLFYPRWHYPAAFQTRLSMPDLALAHAKKWAIRGWRRRPDAKRPSSRLTRSSHNGGLAIAGRAFSLLELPVAPLSSAEKGAERSGCVVSGALAPRRGIDLFARALTTDVTSIRAVLAGTEPGYEQQLQEVDRTDAAVGVTTQDRTAVWWVRSHEIIGICAPGGDRRDQREVERARALHEPMFDGGARWELQSPR